MSSYAPPPAKEGFTILTREQEQALGQANLPATDLAFIFFVNADGKVSTFLPAGTDPDKVRDITDVEYSRAQPLTAGVDVISANTIHYLLARTADHAAKAICYWWTAARCYCCGK